MASLESYRVENGKAIINEIIIEIVNITFIEPLGKGANGIVFKAFDNILQRPIAVKFWLPRSNDKRDKQKQALAEASKLANLIHPNIVTAFTAGQIKSFFYLIMEFVPGEQLKNVLNTNELDLNARFRIWDEIVNALKYAHSIKLYHGDLHEGNIILNKGKVKLIDFGTSIFVRTPNHSLIRESHLIINMVKKLFPEFDMFGVNEQYIKGFNPESVLSLCDTLIDINRSHSTILRGVKRKAHFSLFHIAISIYECPLFDIKEILRWLSQMHIKKRHIIFFLDHLTTYLTDGIKGKWEGHTLVKLDETIEYKLNILERIALKAKKLYLKGQWRTQDH